MLLKHFDNLLIFKFFKAFIHRYFCSSILAVTPPKQVKINYNFLEPVNYKRTENIKKFQPFSS